jgi:hypothetical protein
MEKYLTSRAWRYRILTVKALRGKSRCHYLRQTSNPDILIEARGCEFIYVGKDSHHTLPQEEINEVRPSGGTQT